VLSTTILVPTWQRWEWLAKCLQAVSFLEPGPDEVLVIGRPEDDRSRLQFDAWSHSSSLPSRWLDVHAPGHAPPVRLGVAAVQTDLVAILDDDAEPVTDWLGWLRAPFVHPRVGCVGGQYVAGNVQAPETHPSRVRDAGRLTWFGQLHGDYGELPVDQPIVVDSVYEGNCMWRVGMLRELELSSVFDAGDAFHYGLDLCLQAKAHGATILYEHRAHAVHHWAARPGATPRGDRIARAYIAGRNLTFIGRSRYSGIRRAAFLPWWLLVGERQSYGAAKAAFDMIVHREGTWPAVVASTRGRRDGLRLKARRRG
jgi:GT2 family glycosyltransferase